MSETARGIHQSVTVRAPIATVFRALTVSGELKRWFPSDAQTDPREGGALHYAWNFEDASQNGKQDGHYVEFVSGQSVAHTWDAMPGAPATTVRFELTARGDETTVSLAHIGWGEGAEWDEAIKHHEGPWTFYMANLKSFLETGTDGRAQMLKQITS